MAQIHDGEDDKPAALLDEAADWLLRLDSNPDDVAVRRGFEQWLGQSPAHRQAWQQTQQMWRTLGLAGDDYERVSAPSRVASKPARHSARGGRSTGARRHQRGMRGPVLGAMAAGLVACAWLVAGPSLMIRLQADHITAASESRTVTLADGSTVVLGADSAIKAAFTGDKRDVTLLAGEAFFDVTHDASRPFLVETGDVVVEVLGTAFAVNMTTASTDVALARGQIRATVNVEGNRSETVLQPGEQVIVDNKSGATMARQIAVEDVGGWREGRLVVTDATVGSVVEVIQRYHPAWIAVPDFDLGARRVSGIYDLRNPDQALAALVGPFGGKVRSLSPLLRMVTRF